MREDLAKCTTEHPRAGARGKCFKTKYRGKVPISYDPDNDYLNEYGGFRSSARYRHYEPKSLTDMLGPLRGNLRANLGRRWDDVFSDFCRCLDRRSMAGYHIWTHLMQEVETKTYIEDGTVYSKPQRYQNRFTASRAIRGFYVHPVTGRLEYAPYRTREENKEFWKAYRKEAPIRIPMPGNEPWYYEQMDGLWFRCLEVLKPDPRTGYPGEVRKRSANRKEIQWLRGQKPKEVSHGNEAA